MSYTQSKQKRREIADKEETFRGTHWAPTKIQTVDKVANVETHITEFSCVLPKQEQTQWCTKTDALDKFFQKKVCHFPFRKIDDTFMTRCRYTYPVYTTIGTVSKRNMRKALFQAEPLRETSFTILDSRNDETESLTRRGETPFPILDLDDSETESWTASAVRYLIVSLRQMTHASTTMVRNLVAHVWNWVGNKLQDWFPIFRQMNEVYALFIKHMAFAVLIVLLKLVGVSNRLLMIAMGVYSAVMSKGVPARVIGLAVAAVGAYAGPTNEVNVTVNNTMPRQVQFQADQIDVTAINRVVAIGFGVLLVNFFPSSDAWDKLLLRADRLPRAVNGALALGRHFEDLYAKMSTQVCELLGIEPDIKADLPIDLENNFQEVLELSKAENVCRIPTDQAMRERVQAAFSVYYGLRRAYHSNAQYRTLLDKLQAPITNLMKKATDHAIGATETRQKPVVSLFCGSTGVGKSELLRFLSADILRDLEIIRDDMTDQACMEKLNTAVYSRQVETEFWDTYNCQPICLYDDFGQMVDSTSNPNLEFMEFIRAANRFPMTLHMAELSQKNTTFFKSRHILATTNMSNIHPVSLISPEAVQSRIDIAYKVSIKPEYQVNPTSTKSIDHRLDRNKIPRDAAGNPSFTTDVYQFQEWDVKNNVFSSNIDNYEHVSKRICDAQRAFADGHKRSEKALLAHLRRPVVMQGLALGKMANVMAGAYDKGMIAAIEARQVILSAREKIVNSSIFNMVIGNDWVLVVGMLIAAVTYYLWKPVVIPRKSDWTNKTLLASDISMFIAWMSRCGQKEVYRWLSGGSREYAKIFGDDFRALKLAMMYVELYNMETLSRYSDISLESFWLNWQPEMAKDLVLSNSDIEMLMTRLSEVAMTNSILRNSQIVTLGEMPGRRILSEVRDANLSQYLVGRKEALTPEVDPEGRIFESGREVQRQKKVRVEKFESGRSDMKQRRVRVERDDIICEENEERQRMLAQIVDLQNKLNSQPEKNVIAESFSSSQASEIMLIARRNFAMFNDSVPIFGIKSRWALMNAHYYALLPEDIWMSYHTTDSRIALTRSELVVKRFSRDPEGDVIAVQLPRRFPMFRSVEKHFIVNNQLAALLTRDVVLAVPARGNKNFVEKHGKIVDYTTQHLSFDSGVRKMTYFESTTRSVQGDCGGVYIIDSDAIKNKIAGVHFAGGVDGGALGAPITQEDLSELPTDLCISPPSELVEGQGTLRHAISQGRVKIAPPANIQTSLVKTSIHGMVQETTMRPARLGHIDGEVGLRGLNKVSGDVPLIDQYVLDCAVSSYQERLVGPRGVDRVLTFEEAVQGVEGQPLMRGINRSKSAGYPWSLESSNGKRKWFGARDWEFGSEAQRVKEAVEVKIEKIKNGEYQPSLYTDTLKDETRPIEKVEAGKTRVFAAASMDYVILFRMYFLSFLAFVMSNRIKNEVAVGINAQSPEWHTLTTHITQHGKDRMIAGDFSDYDGTLHPDVLWRVCKIANEWYDDGQDKIREAIFEDVVHSWHVTKNEVNTWTHSQPSGNPGTAVINSIYNSLIMRVAYHLQTGKSMHTFNDAITMISYGDDNLLCVRPDVDVTQETFTAGLAKVGMKYTSEDKSTHVNDFRHITEVSFLKRGFRFDERICMWLAPLAQNSINERLNWQHKVPCPQDTLLQSVEAAIIEWALHSQDDFIHWTRRIQKACYAQNLPCAVYPQLYYLALVRDASLVKEFPHLTYV